MPITSDALWSALYEVCTEGEVSRIPAEALSELIEFKIVERHNGSLVLSPYGEKCFGVLETGDGSVPEFNDYPPE